MKSLERVKAVLPRLLIIDDDEQIARKLARTLMYADKEESVRLCRPTWVTNEADFYHELSVETPDMVSIDLKLAVDDNPESPEGGYRILQRVKQETNSAAIIYSTQAFEIDNNRSFLLGAEDYILKPAEPEKLRGVVQKWLLEKQHLEIQTAPGIEEKIGPWTFAIGNRVIENDRGDRKKLSISEYKFLELALTSKGTVVSEKQAYDELFGTMESHDNRLPNLVYRLRKKLGSDHFIISIRDGGYRLSLTHNA